MTKPNKRVKTSISRKGRYQESAYEKSTLSHLGQRYLKRGICSPTQSKARDVIRKYRMQLRKLEFKRLKNLVPTIKETSDEQSEVQILMHTVQYIDQLHHKLLHQIHSVGLPPQLIKESHKTTSTPLENHQNNQRNHHYHHQNMNMEDLKRLLGHAFTKKMKIKT